MIGIYCILNKNNGKIYIGSSANIARRITTHKYKLRDNIHINSNLQRAYNRQGKHSFHFITLEITTENNLIEREQFWIDSYKESKTYNINPIAANPPNRRGVKLSEEHRKKIGEAGKGKKRSKETIKRITKANKGKNKGRKLSKEHKKKLSILFKGRNKGIKLSDKTKRKMAIARKERKLSEIHKRRISKTLKERRVKNESISKS